MKPSGEITQIISQVAALDKNSPQERATLLQKLNHLRSPMISRIPSEALSRVFWFATRPDEPKRNLRLSHSRDLFRLRAVCSHWRRITESYPHLWTTLVLTQKMSKPATQATDYAGLVRHYCQHVGAAAMSVYISNLGPLPSTTIDIIAQILFKDYPGRLRSLHLLYDPDTSIWPAIFKYAKEDVKFTMLEELELHRSCGNERKRKPREVAVFYDSPHLRRLTLHGGSNIPLKFPWSHITSLNLRDFGLKYSLRLLTLCPNLINLENRFYDLNENLQGFRGREVTSMHSIRNLTWFVRPDIMGAVAKVSPLKPADPITFTQFRFPAVRKLAWDAPLPSYAPHAREFFANMQEVEELKFTPTEWRYSIDQHLDLFCNLTRLEADFSGYDKDTSKWLYLLTIKQGKDNLFPHLQRLDMTTGNALMDELIVLLHSRRNAPVDWSDPQQDSEELILPPHDHTSTHWQSHTPLLEFSHCYDDDRGEFDWTLCTFYDNLEDMMEEAEEVEGFNDSEGSCYAKIVFQS